MPALVKSSVGSPCGTREELRTRRCPLPSKKRRNVSRISFPVQDLVCVFVPLTSPSSSSRLSQTPQPSANEGAAALRKKKFLGYPPLPPFFVTAHSKRLTPRLSASAESKGLICTKIVQNSEYLGTAHSKRLSRKKIRRTTKKRQLPAAWTKFYLDGTITDSIAGCQGKTEDFLGRPVFLRKKLRREAGMFVLFGAIR